MSSKKRLLWKLYPSYLAVVVLAIIAVAWFSSSSFENHHEHETTATLEQLARLATTHIERTGMLADGQAVNAFCEEAGKRTTTRFTVVLADGTVIGDSEENPTGMENHADRPEIERALTHGLGAQSRHSRTLRTHMRYVAVPLMHDGVAIATVRASRPLVTIRQAIAQSLRHILGVSVAVALLSATVTLAVAKRITRPLETMRAGAERFANGDFSHHLPEPDTLELHELATGMNKMATQLAERIEMISQRRNELAAILASMSEGVLAVDKEERLLIVNEGAAGILELAAEQAHGKTVQEVIRNSALQTLIADALDSEDIVEGEITYYGRDGERVVRVRGTALHDAKEERTGAVMVLNDITEIRRLSNIRREFVANVSHELRTPITSLKGFVETLLDGALEQPEDARRFLSIIDTHTERLSAIIDDLLLLSQIEGTSDEEQEVEMPLLPLAGAIDGALRICAARAAEKSIEMSVDCASSLEARINPRLIEELFINLLDNAINYSGKGESVSITARREDRTIAVAVRDEGCGIPEKDLPRIFERFYRVDKARSRALGGTGLGLAIAKHIAQTHGGTIEVESQVNRGTTFTVRLPLA